MDKEFLSDILARHNRGENIIAHLQGLGDCEAEKFCKLLNIPFGNLASWYFGHSRGFIGLRIQNAIDPIHSEELIKKMESGRF